MKSLTRTLTVWTMVAVVAVCIFQWILFIAFHFYEYGTEWEELQEELEEIAFVLFILALGLPLILGAVTFILKRFLKPLKHLTREAQRTSPAGQPGPIQVDHRYSEIHTLGVALNRAFQAYESVLEQARRFSADASHQLRTPLAVMRSEGEVALSSLRSVEEYQETISSMLEEVGHLEHTIRQLQVLARLDQGGSEEWNEVPVDSLLRALNERFQTAAQTRHTDFSSPETSPLTLRANEVLLGEALANLLDNAFHAAGRGGWVSLAVELRGNRILFTLRDSGPGIPEEVRKQIFERFHRAGNVQYEGSGLGLPIAAAIAELHGGRLTLLNEVDGGACFELAIPLNQTPK